MSIGFVSTSVLESKDGIDFNEEKRIESEEVLAAEKRAREAANKPLWQQLAEREEEKEAKFEAVRKAIYAPPKGLDEEEFAYLAGVEQQREEKEAQSKQWEEKELEAFASARASQTLSSVDKPKPPPIARTVAPPKRLEEGQAPILIVKKRKKTATSTSTSEKPAKAKKITASIPDTEKDEKEEGNGGNALSGLLGGYGTSDESES
jgi:hypothetical protein